MLTLQIKAGTMVAVVENDRQRLEKLVKLARMAATQFQHFTIELQSLVDEVSSRQQQSPPLQS